MRNAIAFWGLLFVGFCSCSDETPLLTEIQKEVEVNLQLSSDRVDAQGALLVSTTSDIVTDEFAEYLNQIRDFEVNEFRVELQMVDTTPGQGQLLFERLRLSMSSLETGGLSVEMFELNNVSFTGGVVSLTLFNKDRTATPQINNAISFVRSRLLREQPFSWDLDGEATGFNSGAFVDIKLLLDLTAEVILP